MSWGDEEIPGYTSQVHHSLLEVNRCAGVPYSACMTNVMSTFLISITWQTWLYLPIGLLLHASMAVMTKGDVHRLTKVWRYLRYPAYLSPHGVRRRRRKGGHVPPVSLRI